MYQHASRNGFLPKLGQADSQQAALVAGCQVLCDGAPEGVLDCRPDLHIAVKSAHFRCWPVKSMMVGCIRAQTRVLCVRHHDMSCRFSMTGRAHSSCKAAHRPLLTVSQSMLTRLCGG